MEEFFKQLPTLIAYARQRWPVLWWIAVLLILLAILATIHHAISDDVLSLLWIAGLLVVVVCGALLYKWAPQKMSWRLFAIFLFLLGAVGLASMLTRSTMTILAGSGAFCDLEGEDVAEPQPGASDQDASTDRKKCAERMITLHFQLQPNGTLPKATNEQITLTAPFTYRRSSCSGRTNGMFESCMPEGAKVTEVHIESFSSQNGAFRPFDQGDADQGKPAKIMPEQSVMPVWRTADGRPHCIQIPWTTASGGRTGIGECRFHGTIKFNAKLTGTITTSGAEPIKGARHEETMIRYGDVHGLRIPYAGSNPEGFVATDWKIVLRATEYRRAYGHDFITWRDEVDDQNLKSRCFEVRPYQQGSTPMAEPQSATGAETADAASAGGDTGSTGLVTAETGTQWQGLFVQITC